MITRAGKQSDTVEKKSGTRKAKGEGKPKGVEDSKASQDKTAARHKRVKTAKPGTDTEQSNLKKASGKREAKNSKSGPFGLRMEPASRVQKRDVLVNNKIMTTETNDRSLDLTESSFQGNGILQEALKSTKFVESKYLEVLNRMQEMKRRDKKFDEDRVKHLEHAIDRLTKENQHLKYQMSNIEETIQDKKGDVAVKKTKESSEILDSLRKFEKREEELAARLKELEKFVKPQIVTSQANLKRDFGSQSKTTIDKGCRSAHHRSSINTDQTRSDRTPSPANFKRLLNQAADQLINHPVVGRKITTERSSKPKLLNPLRPDPFQSESTGNLRSRIHPAPVREKTEYMIESMQRMVLNVASECKNLRRDSREVFSKLDNIERVLEK